MTSRVSDALRQQIRQQAKGRCEYCRLPEGYNSRPHHADHIIPIKHQGETALDNLAWSCFACNIAKGTDISAYDNETDTLTPLFSPRTQLWNEHFVIEDAVIVGQTAIGRVTIRVLRMNHEAQIALRRQLIQAGLY